MNQRQYHHVNRHDCYSLYKVTIESFAALTCNGDSVTWKFTHETQCDREVEMESMNADRLLTCAQEKEDSAEKDLRKAVERLRTLQKQEKRLEREGQNFHTTTAWSELQGAEGEQDAEWYEKQHEDLQRRLDDCQASVLTCVGANSGASVPAYSRTPGGGGRVRSRRRKGWRERR